MGAKLVRIENPLVCQNCGSDKVQVRIWAEANTFAPIPMKTDYPPVEDTWCPMCETSPGLITQEEFHERNHNAS